MKFFESDVVQDELKRMQDLYVDINRMGIILTVDQKIQQLIKLLELIDLQQTMFMRVTLSDRPEAKRILAQVREAATLLGMKPEHVNSQFYNSLKEQVEKMGEKEITLVEVTRNGRRIHSEDIEEVETKG